MTDPPIEIRTAEVTRAGRRGLIITVTGEIDLQTVQDVRDAVSAGLDRVADDEGEIVLVVDLSQVTFLGSFGLDALVDATRAARRRREPLRIVVDHARPVIRPIEVTGLDDVLSLHHTVEQALFPPHWSAF